MARADIALALPVGVSADASCALALATEGGIAVEPASLLAAASASVAFLSAVDFSAVLLDLRCAWRDLVNFFSAIGAPACLGCLVSKPQVVASSAPSAACSGPAKHAQIPVADDDQCRAPAGFDSHWQSPHLPAPEAQGELRACPQRGKKRESSGESGRKQGSAARPAAQSATVRRNWSGPRAAGVSRTDRCYEAARADFVVANPGAECDGLERVRSSITTS